ncbi:hypothetical protein GCM10023115_27290 [Pontixanthobacter gangjinensis]|uniref:DUF3857 domain-containing protein n=1 Tax=Christiangramia aestuarii TaxID=1028746 RepID=A0A7K1LN55_9FLAO|nr:DUF3857 domain-containing protein [Christiangramia aestuarii]MUP41960.1 DUF3857 domain-containing protein [Christiangramia aestuarii]
MRQIGLIFSLLILFNFQLSAQNYKFGKVSEEEVLQKEHPLDKEANAAILYRSQKVYYDVSKHTGIELVKEIHERIKIYNKEGFDWATKEIRKYIGGSDEEEVAYLKGYTYNIVDGKLEDEKLRNNEVFEEDKSKLWKITKFTMPAVTEGSVIEYTYKIKSPYLGSIGKTPMQTTIPIDRLELDVKIPEFLIFSKYQNLKSPLNFKLEEGRKNFTYNFTTTHRSTRSHVTQSNTRVNKIEYMMNIYSVEKDNIPALKLEPHVDHLQNYAAFLDWELQYTKFPNSPIENFSQTWEGVAKSIYTDVGLKDEIDRHGFYDDEVDMLISGLSDPMMKAAKIYQFVKQKVKWNQFTGFNTDEGTKNAYKNGVGNIGDINLLLISMLRYANLKAHPILLSTPSNGIPIFPTRDGFNYLIAGLEVGEQLVMLDASDPTAGIGELPKRARNWQGRLIKENGSSTWVSLIPTYLSEHSVGMNMQLTESKLIGNNTSTYKGLYAKKFREDHSGTEVNNDIDNRVKTVDDIAVKDYKIENKTTTGADIQESFDFEIIDAAEVIGDKIFLQPLLFEALVENPFKSDERNYPIFFDFPETKSYTINIMIPEGYKITSLPESIMVKLGNGDGEFKFIINGNNRIIRLISHISFNKIAYQPTEYETLKKFYANIIKKHGEAIVLEKTIEDEFSERAESGR